MNILVLQNFGAEIVCGADSLGVHGIGYQGSLSVNEAELLEKQTGRSVSELALLGIEAAALPEQRECHLDLLRSTMELIAEFDQPIERAVKLQAGGSLNRMELGG